MTQQRADDELLRLTLKVRHPDCWSLRVTADADGGLLNHGAFPVEDGKIKGLFTAYADTTAAVDDIVAAVRDSKLTGSVLELPGGLQHHPDGFDPGNVTRDIFVEYLQENSIESALTSSGFIHDGPVRIHEGYEYWPVIVHCDRDAVRDRIDIVCERKGADIEIQRISTVQSVGDTTGPSLQLLSKRQREVFELARSRGYYEWPRGVSLQELATELDISKATVTEHLRKAEAKLLTSVR
ncbi:helix-turn-helix domain-containing protein [Haloarchaeobius sp. DFWS5]|uniref:helix-turn-helix domain-containing protein n=1 Tax=Haloarchaeobius sp. DFWS5 TaxID=3446114 RepID=UPI003EBD05FF